MESFDRELDISVQVTGPLNERLKITPLECHPSHRPRS
jgi:hypothetical protein